MRITYSESGSVLIHLDTVEDRIIFNAVHGLSANGQVTFSRLDDSMLGCLVNTEVSGPVVHRDLTADQNREVIKYIKSKQKLGAVKAVKEYTGFGLKESKDIVDEFCLKNPDLYPA